MAKLVRHLTSNEEIVSSNLAEGNFFARFNKFPQRFFFASLYCTGIKHTRKGSTFGLCRNLGVLTLGTNDPGGFVHKESPPEVYHFSVKIYLSLRVLFQRKEGFIYLQTPTHLFTSVPDHRHLQL